MNACVVVGCDAFAVDVGRGVAEWATHVGTRVDHDHVAVHHCTPTAGVGRRHAHDVPAGTLFDCPICRRRWRVTQNHPGRVCGCGWERIA